MLARQSPAGTSLTRSSPPAALPPSPLRRDAGNKAVFRLPAGSAQLRSPASFRPVTRPGPRLPHSVPPPGLPRQEHPAGCAHPAATQLDHQQDAIISAPPSRPVLVRKIARAGRARGDAHPARRSASSRKHAAAAARPWPSVEKPTVRTDRPDGMDAVRYVSVDTATHRLTVTRRDTWRDKKETARRARFRTRRAVFAGGGRCWVRTNVG